MTREEAINEIRSWAIPSEKGREVLETLIPELAESEDERIRKELKEAFEAYDIESTWNGIPIRSIFAWLEKQKEQKPAWSEEDEDAINGAIGILLDDNNPDFVFPEHSKLSVGEIVKRLKSLRPQPKPEWSEEDEKMLRTIISDGSRGVELDSKQISFLKSLRPSWISSEEQKEAL